MLKPQQGQDGKEREIQQTNSSSSAPGGQSPLQEQPQLQLQPPQAAAPAERASGCVRRLFPAAEIERNQKVLTGKQATS